MSVRRGHPGPAGLPDGDPSALSRARQTGAGRGGRGPGNVVDGRRVATSSDPGGTEREPSSSATTTAGRSSRFVRARTARVESSRPATPRHRPLETDGLVRRHPAPGRLPARPRDRRGSSWRTARRCARRAERRVRRPAAGSGSSPRGRPGGGPGRSAASPRIRGRRPAASRRSTGRRRRRGRSGSPGRPGAAPAGAARGRRPGPRRRGGAAQRSRQRAEGRRPLEARDRAQDEVVEVEAAARRDGRLVGDEGPARSAGLGVGGVVGRHAELDLEPRDDRVEAQEAGLVGPRRDLGQDGRPIGERFDATPRSRRISRPSAWNVRTRTAPGATPERRDRRVEALGHLDGCSLVEGDRPDRLGRRRPSR